MKAEDLEKLTKLEELPIKDILKVANCLYVNERDKEKKSKECWFICSCSVGDLSLICQECANNCHAHHEGKVDVTSFRLSNPICKCGKFSHRISEQLENNYNSYIEKYRGRCFISDMTNLSINKGFYQCDDNTICSYCYDNKDCHFKDQEKFTLIPNSHLGLETNFLCKCIHHQKENFLYFSTTKIENIPLKNYICNFNFNIFRKIHSFNQSLFVNNNNKIGENCNGDINTLYKIYNEFSLLNLAKSYQEYDIKYHRKYDYLKNYFDKLDINKFFQNLRDHNLIGKDKNYFYSQALLINMIFNIYIKSYYVKNNNLFAIDAIINMNPFQRNFFLIESKNFNKYTKNFKEGAFSEKYREEKEINLSDEDFDNFVDAFIDAVLDLSDNFIKQIGTHITQGNDILDKMFMWINKIFKFLIKYNLISNEKRFRFFEIMLDAFTLCSTGNFKDLNNSSYYLLRISFYCFLYKNDECVIKAMRENDLNNVKKELKDFSFICTEDSEIISKIFINCINKFIRKENYVGNKRSLKVDYNIKKIFDLLLSKEDFYKKSLKNLFYHDGMSIQQFLNPSEIFNQKHIQETIQSIHPLIKDIIAINRAYMDYNINYTTFIENMNTVLKNLQNCVKYLLGFEITFPKKLKKFYLETTKRNDYENQAIFNFQISIRYTQFFQTLLEFMSTYHEVVNFYGNTNDYDIPLLDRELIKFLLVLLYLSIDKNDENFALFLMFDSSHIISLFFEIKEEFNLFLKILNNTFFRKIEDSNFSFTDYKYFSNFINSLINHVSKLSDDTLKIEWLIIIMKILQKDIKYLHIRDLDLLSSFEFLFKILIDCVINICQVSDEEVNNFHIPDEAKIPVVDLEEFNSLTKKFHLKKVSDLIRKKRGILSMHKFCNLCFEKCQNSENQQDLNIVLFSQYISFLNEINFNGFYYLNCFKNVVFLDNKLIEDILNNINNYSLPLDLEINLTRYYELFKFFPNFKINESIDILQNMYFSVSEFYLKYNDNYEKQYTFNQVQNILSDPNFIVNNDYKKNEINYETNLNQIKIKENQEQEQVPDPEINKEFNFKKINFNNNFELYKLQNIEKFCFCLDFLVMIMKRFDYIINKILSLENTSNCDKLISIFNYFQHCIIRPLYFTINYINEQNIVLIEKISVKELFKIFEVAVNFLKATIILYERTSLINSDYKELSNIFSKFDFDVMSKIPLNIELQFKQINHLKNYILEFKSEKIKYFEFKEIVNIIHETMKTVLISDDDSKSQISDQSDGELAFDQIPKADNLPQEIFDKIVIINKKYVKKKDLTFDDGLSLIKALDSSMGNFKARKIIINYLKNKMVDNLTSFTITEEYVQSSFREDYKLYAIDIDNYKFENAYCIYYLNIILNNDSQKCQNFLSTSYSIFSTKSYITSYINYFVFGNFVYEITKFNELDYISEFKEKIRSNFTFELITLTLKFLQNLCEGHNKEFQTILFNIYLVTDELKPKLAESCLGFKNRHRTILEQNVTRDTIAKINMENNLQDNYQSVSSVPIMKVEETDEKKTEEKEEIKDENELLQNKNKDDFLKIESIDNNQLEKKVSDLEEAEIEEQEFISKTATKVIHKKEENNNDRQEDINKPKSKNDAFLQFLPYKPTSFPNFIFTCMKIIINNIQYRTNKNCEDILEIYQKYSDLTVEIIQGTPSSNLYNFYKELKDVTLYDAKEKKMQYDNLIFFQFVNLSQEVKEILYDFNILDSVLIQIKYNIFFIMTNILNCENVDHETVKLFAFIFDPKKLIELLAKYLIVIYLKHIEGLSIDDTDFAEKYITCDLDNSMIPELLDKFRVNNKIYEDEIYKLSAQIYLFITILGEKYGNIEANSIINLFVKEDQKDEEDETSQNITEKVKEKQSLSKKKVHIKKEENQSQETVIKNKNDLAQQKLVSVQSLNLASRFFKELIKSCEFIIPTEDENKEDEFDWECFDFLQDESDDDDDDDISGIKEEGSQQIINNLIVMDDDEIKEDVPIKQTQRNLKKIYFIMDPKVFLISDTNINNFFENADRSNPTNKLKYLLISLEDFYIEVKYKLKNVESNEKMKKLFKIDYTNVDYSNLLFSLIIVFILLGFLNERTMDSWYVFGTLMFLEFLQVIMNISFLYIFYQSKYNFYVSKEKRKYHDIQLTTKEKFEIYVLKSFLLNNEVYLMNLNIIIGIVVLLRPSFIGLFILQLFTVIKFSPTIQQIVEAFRIRVSQLMNMIGFLAILIYFYANISFFFFSGEFVKSTDSGYDENLCQSLAECSITYFNHGVRSGGGIGDLLDLRSSSSSMYFPRYFLDLLFYITVILLLLNMINGVIVSTFSQIREDSTRKVEDMKNRCYICSIERGDFEKSQISFDKHISIDHNYITYIQFLIFLKFFNEKDMDSDQSYIISCIKNKDIGCFPIGRALSLKAEIKENN